MRAQFLPLITFGTCRSLWIPYNIRGQNLNHFSHLFLKYYKMILACVCFVNIEDLFLGSPQPVNPPRPFKHSERRRRSQRLATLPMPDDSVEKVSPPSPATDGKVFSISSQTQQESSVPEGNVYWFPIEPNIKKIKIMKTLRSFFFFLLTSFGLTSTSFTLQLFIECLLLCPALFNLNNILIHIDMNGVSLSVLILCYILYFV